MEQHQPSTPNSSTPSSPSSSSKSTAKLPSLQQPSLFDLLAAESLLQTTRPALKKLVQCVADCPSVGGGGELGRWVRRWSDEVTLLLEIGLHYYFLRKHGASFAENFYGLKRVGDTNGQESGLSRVATFKSLLVVVLLPYARKKMAEIYEKLSRMKENGELESVRGKHSKQVIEAFLAAYPLLAVCSQSSTLAYQLLYALGRSKFHDPFQHLCGGFYLAYSPPPPPQPTPSSSVASSGSLVKSTVNGLFRMSSRLAGHAFSVGLFLVQFFDVFDAEGRSRGGRSADVADSTSASSFSSSIMDEYSHRMLKRLDALIAPPKMATPTDFRSVSTHSFSSLSPSRSKSTLDVAGPSSPTKFGNSRDLFLFPGDVASENDGTVDSVDVLRRCPICGGRRRNDAALSVSGFVFCYDCISNYIKRHGVCPVTKLPAKANNLVRLYPGF